MEYENNAGRSRDLLKQIIGFKPFTKAQLGKIVRMDEVALVCDVQLIDNQDIIYYDVRLLPSNNSTNVIFPKLDSLCIFSEFEGGFYVSQITEVDSFYQATGVESILDIMLDFIKAIKEIKLLTSQGPTMSNGVINISDFLDIENRLKSFYKK